MKQILLVFTLLICSFNTYALFCPTNYTTIKIGDTLEHVLEVCGPPATQNSFRNPTNAAQEWVYYLQDKLPAQSNAKMNVLFKNDKVTNIEVFGASAPASAGSDEKCLALLQSKGSTPELIKSACQDNSPAPEQQRNVESTAICGANIHVGDSTQAVEFACGKPAIVNMKENPEESPVAPYTMITYNGPPVTTLIFQNGRLTESNV